MSNARTKATRILLLVVVVILIIILFNFLGISNTDRKIEFTDRETTKQWINDSLGCNGFRKNFTEKHFNKELFLNRKFDDFLLNFGRANYAESKDNLTTYTYFISCSEIPVPINADGSLGTKPKKKLNAEAYQLVITTDRNNIIIAINMLIP